MHGQLLSNGLAYIQIGKHNRGATPPSTKELHAFALMRSIRLDEQNDANLTFKIFFTWII